MKLQDFKKLVQDQYAYGHLGNFKLEWLEQEGVFCERSKCYQFKNPDRGEFWEYDRVTNEWVHGFEMVKFRGSTIRDVFDAYAYKCICKIDPKIANGMMTNSDQKRMVNKHGY